MSDEFYYEKIKFLCRKKRISFKKLQNDIETTPGVFNRVLDGKFTTDRSKKTLVKIIEYFGLNEKQFERLKTKSQGIDCKVFTITDFYAYSGLSFESIANILNTPVSTVKDYYQQNRGVVINMDGVFFLANPNSLVVNDVII